MVARIQLRENLMLRVHKAPPTVALDLIMVVPMLSIALNVSLLSR